MYHGSSGEFTDNIELMPGGLEEEEFARMGDFRPVKMATGYPFAHSAKTTTETVLCSEDTNEVAQDEVDAEKHLSSEFDPISDIGLFDICETHNTKRRRSSPTSHRENEKFFDKIFESFCIATIRIDSVIFDMERTHLKPDIYCAVGQRLHSGDAEIAVKWGFRFCLSTSFLDIGVVRFGQIEKAIGLQCNEGNGVFEAYFNPGFKTRKARGNTISVEGMLKGNVLTRIGMVNKHKINFGGFRLNLNDGTINCGWFEDAEGTKDLKLKIDIVLGEITIK